MSLIVYKKKRNLNETTEPVGTLKKSEDFLSFVVQRHKAKQLHYDFRLELDGDLKSWAVPKGPSMNPKDKRLSVMVEDHPYDYKDFQGIIPEGNYGAGIVEIWDKGTYTDSQYSQKSVAEKMIRDGLEAGNIKFILSGEKLKGEFALVQLRGKSKKNWLLIKHHDQYAVDNDYNSEDYTEKNSPINKWLRESKA